MTSMPKATTRTILLAATLLAGACGLRSERVGDPVPMLTAGHANVDAEPGRARYQQPGDCWDCHTAFANDRVPRAPDARAYHTVDGLDTRHTISAEESVQMHAIAAYFRELLGRQGKIAIVTDLVATAREVESPRSQAGSHHRARVEQDETPAL